MAMQFDKPGAVKVFLVYAHKDEVFAEELGEHLDNLQRQGLIADWYGRDLAATEDKIREIEHHLKQAALVLLLVSASFVNSEYCYGAEIKQIMARRQESQDAWVIPIIVRPCDWRGTPFANIVALPSNGKPVSKWSDRDEAFIDIINAIRKVLPHITITEP